MGGTHNIKDDPHVNPSQTKIQIENYCETDPRLLGNENK